MEVPRILLEEYNKTCDLQDDRVFFLQHVFLGTLVRWVTPKNRTWRHKSRKNFDGPRRPVPQRECVVVNSWIHDKHGDQGGPLGQKYSRVRDVYIRGPFFRIFHQQSDHIVWIYSSRFVSPQTHNLNFVPGIISGTKRDYTCTTCVGYVRGRG